MTAIPDMTAADPQQIIAELEGLLHLCLRNHPAQCDGRRHGFSARNIRCRVWRGRRHAVLSGATAAAIVGLFHYGTVGGMVSTMAVFAFVSLFLGIALDGRRPIEVSPVSRT